VVKVSKKAINLAKLDRRYIKALLDALEIRRQEGLIDAQLYGKLKEQYSAAYDVAEEKAALREGFVTLQAIAPNPLAIKDSVTSLLKRIRALNKEMTRMEARLEKLDELYQGGNISEAVYQSKKKEYEILLMKYQDQKQEFLNAIPNSLKIIRQMQEGIDEQLEELTVEAKIDSKKSVAAEKNQLKKLKKEVAAAAKQLSALMGAELQEDEWMQPTRQAKAQKTSATFIPLQKEMPTAVAREVPPPPPSEPLRPPPRTTVVVKWKNLIVGKLIGEVSLIGKRYAVFVTDRPSLAILRDIAVTGPPALKATMNPKVIEEKLQKIIQDKYGIPLEEALYPEHVVRFAIENKVGVDLFRLINSYYASVVKEDITVANSEAIVKSNAQIMTLAEKVNLLGKRVLAPDRSLIGVIHELFYDSVSSHLYTFTFKGVPPHVIRKIYKDIHRRAVGDATFGAFRQEISTALSIPIYESLTPSSILRYALLNGLIKNLSQLETLVENMNPRISKAADISAITPQGIILSRFPQNALPSIEYFVY